MVRPDQPIKEILAASRRPLDRLRRWAGRLPQPSPNRTDSGDPRVVQALEKLIRGDMSAWEARRRIAPGRGTRPRKPGSPRGASIAFPIKSIQVCR